MEEKSSMHKPLEIGEPIIDELATSMIGDESCLLILTNYGSIFGKSNTETSGDWVKMKMPNYKNFK